ncbi:hypothetical protein cand_016860 [Cryptosporidium andersoni]|uniref:Uncharacterized protein n=1 Tax=Cryptosporidium andersoni TaxID=117008 RepID=A0A1J4MTN4_9CRYT|nr:hypothetical protein cand_016860 [Cryptosporidium andersoni]
MFNLWSIGRFPCISNAQISTSINNFGYYAYSINTKIIIIDLNLMIEGNNDNILFGSNTWNRFNFEIPKINNIIWKINENNSNGNIINNIDTDSNIKIANKSLYIEKLFWGPYINYKWSCLFTCINNGIVYIWLLPILDSFSLAIYNPSPSFNLIDILRYNYIEDKEYKIRSYDWLYNNYLEDEKCLLVSFCNKYLLNTDNPILKVPILSIQSNIGDKINLYIVTSCWDDYIILYIIYIPKEFSKENYIDKFTNSFEDNLIKQDEYIYSILPYKPLIICNAVLIYKLPKKIINNKFININDNLDEIVTTSYTSSFNSEYKFEVIIGTSIGRLLLFRFKLDITNLSIICIEYRCIYEIFPKIPISHMKIVIINNNNNNLYYNIKDDDLLLLWCIGIGNNVIIGNSIISYNNLETSIEYSSVNKLNLSSQLDILIHNSPICGIHYIDDIIIDDKLIYSFITIDKSGIGILHKPSIKEKGRWGQIKILYPNKIFQASSSFPNIDQSIYTNESSEILEDRNKDFSKKLENIQSIPNSIQINRNANDYKVISFNTPLSYPGNNLYNNNINYSYFIIMLYSSSTHTIRLILMFNPISAIDYINKRLVLNLQQTYNSGFKGICNYIKFCKDFRNICFFDYLIQSISQPLILNDIRLILGGPITIRGIPQIEEINNHNHNHNHNHKQYNDLLNKFNIKLKPFSAFNFKLGKILLLKIKDKLYNNMETKYKSNEEFNDNNNDSDENILTLYLSIFREFIPENIIQDALEFNSIHEYFPDILSENYIRTTLANLLLLLFCYIHELEMFTPKNLQYTNLNYGMNHFKNLIEYILKFYMINNFTEIESNNNMDIVNNIEFIISYFKFLYFIRLITSYRCLITFLYSRYIELFNDDIIQREEDIANYLVQLKIFSLLYINKINELYGDKIQNILDNYIKNIHSSENIYNEVKKSNIIRQLMKDIEVTNSNNVSNPNNYFLNEKLNLNYIWGFVKNLQDIKININDLYNNITETDCILISKPPYTIYKCLRNYPNIVKDPIISNNTYNNSDVIINQQDDDKELLKNHYNCINNIPACPITLFPVEILEDVQILSCNFCGRITYMKSSTRKPPLHAIPHEIGEIRKRSFLENYVMQTYLVCSICLNITVFIQI